jgi:hypothetical protein
MPRRRGSAAAATHAERMRALLAQPGLPLTTVGQDPGGEKATATQRARGRPPGAKNWATGQLAAYLEARGYMHPAIGWAEICSRPIQALALELRIPNDKAADIWLRASQLLAAVVVPKLPVAVVDKDGAVTLVIEGLDGVPGAAASAPGGGVMIEGAVVEADEGKSGV